MAASKTNLSVFRGIIRELQRIHGKKKFLEAPAYTYLKERYRKQNLTSETYCRDKADLLYQANTYLSYLQSTRKYQEISDLYKGDGERGIEETARIVGFKLPQVPKNDTK